MKKNDNRIEPLILEPAVDIRDKQTIKETMRASEQADPELWRKLYPRNYQPYKPDLYPSPKCVAHQAVGIVKKVEYGYLGQSERYEMLWVCRLVQQRMPQYYVSWDLLDAIMHTTPPMEMDWYNYPFPREGISFILPRGFLTHETEGNISFISFGRYKAKEDIPNCSSLPHPLVPHTWSSINGSMTLFALSENIALTHWNIPHDAFEKVDLRKLYQMVEQYENHEHSSSWQEAFGRPLHMTKEDTRMGAKVAHLIFGLLLFMQRKPELITDAAPLKRIPAKRGEMPKQFWSAPVLGIDYKVRRMPGPSLGGTHASPREHWVAGYWREQPYGPGLTLRKDVLIDPYLRGGV